MLKAARSWSVLACLFAAAALLGTADVAHAALWRDVTAPALGAETAGWTNKVELADLNGDGLVDLLFANGGDYNMPNDPQRSGIYINQGPGPDGTPRFADRSMAVLGEQGGIARVIKAADLDGNGTMDIVIGNTYETTSRLLLGDGNGAFVDRSDLLPNIPASVGDIEVGDIDDDGDLDLVLADWGLDDGAGALLDPFTAPGGRTMLWRNELQAGAVRFVDATADAMPDVLVKWSWELELIDVEGDFDLDVLVSCKTCTGSFMFRNQGGRFTNNATGLPQFTNNYDFEPMFIKRKGSTKPQLAVVTINDGEKDDPADDFDLREHIFIADAKGKFTDASATLWPPASNVGADDNMISVLDFDSDGDPDFLVGALGPDDDRLLVNDLAASGTFLLATGETGLSGTPGTLGIAVADLNGDRKPDVVQSQGELADPEKVWIGDEIVADTAKPIVHAVDPIAEGAAGVRVRARVHDNKSPNRPHDWQKVELRWIGVTNAPVAMTWQGEFLFSVALESVPAKATGYRVCAIDAAGNEGCGADLVLSEDDKFDDLGGDDDESGGEGCGCRTSGEQGMLGSLLAVVLVALRRRK